MRAIVLTALLLAGAGPAAAQPNAPQSVKPFTDCAAIVADAERLACYDRAVAAVAPALGAEMAERQQAADAAAAATMAEAAVTSFGRESMREPPPPAAADARASSLEASVVEVLTDASKRLVIILDNGQMWRQQGQAIAMAPKPGTKVVLKRGAMGSFRMVDPARKQVLWVIRMR
jgi:hypothetical protein